ncbi:MAG: hypothetical protein ACW98I_19615 [Candidatus Hodarchaeales archaeon]|jgi:hypothetical protein
MKEQWLSEEAKQIHQNTVLENFTESIEILANLKILINSDKITIEGVTLTTKKREMIKEGIPYVLGMLKRKVRMLKIEWNENQRQTWKDKLRNFFNSLKQTISEIMSKP